MPGLPVQFATLLLLLLYESDFKLGFTVVFMRHYTLLLESDAPFVVNTLDRLTVHLLNQPVRTWLLPEGTTMGMCPRPEKRVWRCHVLLDPGFLTLVGSTYDSRWLRPAVVSPAVVNPGTGAGLRRNS